MPFLKKFKQKLKKIRRSDEATKRNWLIGSTIVAMIIVITLWVGYLNLTVPDMAPAKSSEETPAEKVETSDGEDSIFSVFSRGFRVTFQSASDTINDIKNQFSEIFSKTKKRLENVKEYKPENSNQLSN